MEEQEHKAGKPERILKISFYILVIACILLLGAWFAKLAMIWLS